LLKKPFALPPATPWSTHPVRINRGHRYRALHHQLERQRPRQSFRSAASSRRAASPTARGTMPAARRLCQPPWPRAFIRVANKDARSPPAIRMAMAAGMRTAWHHESRRVCPAREGWRRPGDAHTIVISGRQRHRGENWL